MLIHIFCATISGSIPGEAERGARSERVAHHRHSHHHGEAVPQRED